MIRTAMSRACVLLLMSSPTYLAGADELTEAYNEGYKAGFSAGLAAAGGNGGDGGDGGGSVLQKPVSILEFREQQLPASHPIMKWDKENGVLQFISDGDDDTDQLLRINARDIGTELQKALENASATNPDLHVMAVQDDIQ